MKNLFKFYLVLMFVAFAGSTFGQGSTTSGISGKITGDENAVIPGAVVVAIHTPTGSEYATMSDDKGYYRLPGMNVGGPYKVTVSFIGLENIEKDNIFLTLGQTFRLNVNMTKKADEAIGEVVVIALKNPIIDGNRTGAETVIGVDGINSMPTVARDLSDFMRLTPQVSVTGDGINIAGANNRYNSIYIDGAVNNDVFGLAGSGTNGGQLGISPISIDAIEQFQVVIAPFDVRQGGFSGGGINAVTRSGSNQFEGSAYYFVKNENFVGLTPTYGIDDGEDRVKLDEFNAQTFGFRLGGPIIKNKLFFFANAEMQRDNTPQPFKLSDYNGDASQADIDALVSKLNKYDYDPGDFTNNTNTLQSDKFLLKLDYNINKHHKLMIRHHYTKGHMINAYASNPGNINFDNTGQDFISVTNSSSLELKSYFSNKFANKLIIGYTNVNDDRDPMGENFPWLEIDDGSGTIHVGSEQYSTGNQLKQSIFTITDNFQIYKGKHTFTIGTHNEFYSIYNLYLRQNFGVYEYDDLDQFLNDDPATTYYSSYSLVDDITGDGTAAGIDFNFMQLGVYIQDEFQVSDEFKISAGIRLDIPIFYEEPYTNVGFNDSTLAKIDAFYDVEGVKAGQMPKTQFMISPRIGFNYDIGGNKMTQIRGGVGIFTSRIPFVWPGGVYNNNGYNIGGSYAVNQVFNPQWDDQPTTTDLGGTESLPSGQMDLFVEDFKFPQVLKGNIGIDQKLPWGMIGTLEFMYSKTLNNVFYQNLNVAPTDSILHGADNRPDFNDSEDIESAYSYIMVGSNTNEGYTYNLTAQVQKQFDKGFIGSIAYTYGVATAVFDGTSSQNSSQWRYYQQVNGRNNAVLTRSDFDMGSRVVGFLSYNLDYVKYGSFTMSVYYNGQSGKPFSYVYGDRGYLTGETGKPASLIYVPANESEINLVDIGNPGEDGYVSAANQWNRLDAFIESDAHLKERRGNYAERNESRLPFFHTFDVKLIRDFYFKLGEKKHTLQFTLDIFNVGNLINKDWGRFYYTSSHDIIEIIDYEGMNTDDEPTFSFDAPDYNEPWYIIDYLSRWKAQFGIRYIF